MRQAKFKITEEKAYSFNINRRVREGVLIVSIAFSIFLLLALITYHTSDPSWSHTGGGIKVANIGGYVGAWLADVLLFVFGYVAFIFPFLLGYAAWMPFQTTTDFEGRDIALFALKCFGFLLILAAGSGLTNIYLASHLLPATAGGVVGDLLSRAMIHILNPIGTKIILLALLLCGITLFSGLSWLQVIDLIGAYTVKLGRLIAKLRKLIVSRKSGQVREKRAKVEPRLPSKKEKIQIQINQLPQQLVFEATDEGSKPSIELLDKAEHKIDGRYNREELETLSQEVELRLEDFGIAAQVVAVHPGPVITRFELRLAAGTKVSKITTLAKDLARSLSVISVRVVEVIPGKPVIGLELPNKDREIVRLREILASKQYKHANFLLSIALGKDIAGNPVFVDLARMPHLLLAGTTGSGKSVGLNAILLSLLYKYSPAKMRLILIDPKMLELSVYDGIPHLLTPVVTNMKDAANALRWCVAEMERRYKLMAAFGVRNLTGFNNKLKEAKKRGQPLLDPFWESEGGEEAPKLQELPFIVLLADEYADMIIVVGKKIEELIARIAQKARAAGIHLVLATQRPSVDVITGLIKANIPSRIAFQVSSKIDSRTIIDQMGAEQLLGNGDMLYLPPGTVVPKRVHGAFVSDEEVHKVAKDLKRRTKPNYITEILEGNVPGVLGIDPTTTSEDEDAEQDPLYDQAVQFILDTRRVSISSIQRRLKIGYNRAARIVEAMEAAKLVSPMQSNGSREILVNNES